MLLSTLRIRGRQLRHAIHKNLAKYRRFVEPTSMQSVAPSHLSSTDYFIATNKIFKIIIILQIMRCFFLFMQSLCGSGGCGSCL